MGPSKEDTGYEQGGINSGDYYKLINNEQLKTAQESCLGVAMGPVVVSAVGEADDVILSSNNITDLHLLATLTERYCQKYRVKLVPSKTKLLVYSNENHKNMVDLAILTNPININGIAVKFSKEAEHVGIIRNISGNMPNLLNRIISHKRAIGSVLSAGLARSHRGNPAASLRVHQLYCSPVLFSGLAAQVLSRAEIKILDSHFQNTLQDLQRLHTKAPRSVVLFLAGSIPGEGILHTKQLTLFSMICRLPTDPLNTHARHVLTCSPPSAKSWFQQIRNLCLLYSLPHPLQMLDSPPTKGGFKNLVKSNVTQYWQNILMKEAMELSSLGYFRPSQYSLRQPSILWTSAGGSSYECAKSNIVAKMISGRYRSEDLCKHWTPSNRNGFCLADTCTEVRGDLTHILVECKALNDVRNRLKNLWYERSAQLPALHHLISMVLSSPPSIQVQFILDPSLFPAVTLLWEIHGQPLLDHVYYLTRTYAYYTHRERMIMLGRWPGDPGRGQKKLTFDRTKFSKTNNNLPPNIISNVYLFPGSYPTCTVNDTTTTSVHTNGFHYTDPLATQGPANKYHESGHGGADSCGAVLALPVDCDMAVGVGCTYVGTGIAVVDTVGMMGEHSVASAVSISYSPSSTFHSAQ